MSDITDWLEENWSTIQCQTLQTISDTGMIAAAASPFSGFIDKRLQAGLSTYSAVGLAAQAAFALSGCSGTIPDDPNYDENAKCNAVAGVGTLWADYEYNDVRVNESRSDECVVTEILEVTQLEGRKWQCRYQDLRGQVRQDLIPVDFGTAAQFWIKPCMGSHCIGSEPTYDRPTGPIGPTIPGPEIDDCKWTFTPIDSYVDIFGVYHQRIQANPIPADCGTPFTYWESEKGPYIPNPIIPDPPPPDPYNGNNNFVVPNLPAWEYFLEGVCEDSEEWGEEEGEQPELYWYGEEKNAFEGLAERMEAISEMIDFHLFMRTPTCKNEKPELEGAWVSTRWISDETMSHSGHRLRKLFRYRSKGGRFLPDLTAWWADFEWRSGDVCVIHKGAWWGTPQIWAETEEEGQRVIRHAAAEAGLDPDQIGEWIVSSSRSPRIGMPGTMRIQRKDGFPWVSSRDGSSFPNILAQPLDP